MATNDDAQPGPANPCEAKKLLLRDQHTALTAQNHALGTRISDMRSRCEAIQAAYSPDSPCAAQAQGFAQSLDGYLATTGPAWIELDNGIANAISAINCSLDPATVDAQIGAAEAALVAMATFLDQADQNVGTFEASCNSLTDDCPVPPA